MAAGILFLLLVGRQAQSQHTRRLQVLVVDSATGAAVDRADVRVSTSADVTEIVSRAITDSSGRVLLLIPAHVHLLMTVRRLGFAMVDAEIDAATADDSLLVAIVSTATTLRASVTRAAPMIRKLALNGFYDRRQVGIGSFLDSATIADQKPLDLFSVLRRHLKGCTMIFVDGVRMLGIRDVDVREVVGIEIYRSNVEAPPQFQNPIESSKRCGSIVIWRRI